MYHHGKSDLKDSSPFTVHTSRLTPHTSRKSAFTLAEVLITLGIIGVVAALVLSPMINNYKKKMYLSNYKTAYNTISNALSLAVAEHGAPTTWGIISTEKNNVLEFRKRFFEPYLKIIIKKSGVSGTQYSQYTTTRPYGTSYINYIELANGYRIIVSMTGRSFGSSMTLYGTPKIDVDINAEKAPNIKGIDMFSFIYDMHNQKLYPEGVVVFNYLSNDRESEDYANYTTSIQTRANLIKNCKNNSNYCPALIFVDGWEIFPDNPIKL